LDADPGQTSAPIDRLACVHLALAGVGARESGFNHRRGCRYTSRLPGKGMPRRKIHSHRESPALSNPAGAVQPLAERRVTALHTQKGKFMTTIIERPSGDDSGRLVVIALIVGAIAAGAIGLFAFGAFDGRGSASSSTSVTVEQPLAPSPMAPATTPPSQNAAPAAQPAAPATPDSTPSEPSSPPPPAQ